MSLVFCSGGFLTTVQDAGRIGYQQYGVPAAGAVDPRSLALANILVGNAPGEAALEVTLLGPEIEFEEDCILAVTGADLGALHNGAPLQMYCVLKISRGDRLSFEMPKSGCRAYVAFAGGLDIPPVMGSRSTYIRAKIGGLRGRKLQAGDRIDLRSPAAAPHNLPLRRCAPEDFSPRDKTLRVVPGPQDDRFTAKGLETFFNSVYTVTAQSDRMGCRLEGPLIEHVGDGNIISDGIAFGAVQVPSEGKPIVMLADRHTTGGYTKIANVVTVDLPLIAQAMAGDRIRFEAVDIEQAQRLLLSQKEAFEALARRLNAAPPSRLLWVRVNGRGFEVRVEREESSASGG